MKDINKILAKTHFKCKKKWKNPHFLRKHVSLSCLRFSLMFSEGEVKSPYFLQVWRALGSLYFVLSYCCLCQCQAVCYHYMPVSTKYHWNISFQKKMFIEVCCQKCQKCNTICVTTFFYWISRVCKKKELNIYTRILDIMKL